MAKEPNWHKQTAISGWANFGLTVVLLGVTLWLGLREPAAAQPSVPSINPADPPFWSFLMGPHLWAIVISIIYIGGTITAALVHLRASRSEKKPDKTSSEFVLREEYERMMRSSTSHETIRDELKRQLADCKTELETTVSETQALREANRVFQEELNRLPALTIHSAVYGAGHVGREDLPVAPDKLRARNALVMRVQNSALVPRDPAEVPKRLLVRYSFENAEIREAIFKEGDLMVLPEPRSKPLAPKIEIAPSAPQGGMLLFPPGVFQPDFPGAENGNWFHFSVSIRNTDASMSVCDLVVTLEFEEESAHANRRVIERALFRDDGLMTFPRKVSCLEAGQAIDCIIAVWSGAIWVQTIRGWSAGPSRMPLGEELHPGIWWCNVTVKAQGIEQQERYRFKMIEHGMSRFMLPPSTSGEKG
jgi:hypothetical protein